MKNIPLHNSLSFPLLLTGMALLLALTGSAVRAKTLTSAKTEVAPVIDGQQEALWQKATPITTYDPIAGTRIELRSLHNDRMIFLLIRFADPDESRQHRLWHWSEQSQMYEEGPEREDAIVLKWAIAGGEDLSLKSDQPYVADIWYWKACRTDPQGVADDKIQRLTTTPGKRSKKVISASGRPMFLFRGGDQGSSAYKTVIYVERHKDIMPRFSTRPPAGSRGDIRAKGVWKDGFWTVEMARLLVTGHDDDLNFRSLEASYPFGVSRFEIAGLNPDPKADVPRFDSGDISETLRLQFR